MFSNKQTCKNQPKRAWEDLKKNIGNTMLVNYSVWPFIMIINFLLVPYKVIVVVWINDQYQTLLVNIVSIFWTTFLSFKANAMDKKMRLEKKSENEVTNDVDVKVEMEKTEIDSQPQESN